MVNVSFKLESRKVGEDATNQRCSCPGTSENLMVHFEAGVFAGPGFLETSARKIWNESQHQYWFALLEHSLKLGVCS